MPTRNYNPDTMKLFITMPDGSVQEFGGIGGLEIPIDSETSVVPTITPMGVQYEERKPYVVADVEAEELT